VAIRGVRAGRLTQALLDGAADLVPTDVRVRVGRSGSITASTSPFLPVRDEQSTSTQSRGYKSWATFGVGVPLVFGRLGIRLAAQAALGNIQHAINGVHDQPWPGPGYQPHTRVEGSVVRAWFENASGEALQVATIPLSTVSRPRQAAK
jgi:hypothetical protein